MYVHTVEYHMYLVLQKESKESLCVYFGDLSSVIPGLPRDVTAAEERYICTYICTYISFRISLPLYIILACT